MRKQSILLVLALVCALAAGFIFYYNNVVIPGVCRQQEEKLRKELDEKAMPRMQVAIISSEEGIAKYTVLTDEVINSKVKMVDVPVKYVVKNAAADINLLRGKVTKEDLRFGEQVMQDSLSSERKWFGEYDRLKEYGVDSIVAGEVKTGNIIDVVVSYENGDYDVVVPKIKVQKLIVPENGGTNKSEQTAGGEKAKVQNGKTGDTKNGSYTIVVAVNEEQYRDLELAREIGRLQTRLYLDESQPESVKTFNYSKALIKMKLENVNPKTENPAKQTAAKPVEEPKNDQPIKLGN